MRAGSQTDDEEARVGIAERRHGFPPIRPFTICASLYLRDMRTVLHQAIAVAARDHLAVEKLKLGHSFYFRPAASTVVVGSAPVHLTSAVGPYVAGTGMSRSRRQSETCVR